MECGSNEFFLQDASLSTFIRFRRIASQTLIEIHRQHLDAEKRDAEKRDVEKGDVGRELPIQRPRHSRFRREGRCRHSAI